MEFRYLGNSGLKISEITYGNWLTHGSQVENDAATACVRAALDAGISTFDTADVYGDGRSEQLIGRFLRDHDGFPWWRVVTSTGRLVPGLEAEQAGRLAAEGVEVHGGRVRGGPADRG